MDERLVAWARSVKARDGTAARTGRPVLWLFTDAGRLPDPLAAIARLPRGLCGVVFRHDGVSGRAVLARRVALLCRRRGLALTVAGDWRLAARLGAGEHLRAGERRRLAAPCTASAHDAASLRRGLAMGARVFLSPAFATRSHPGAPALGAWRWSALAARANGPVFALGGVQGGCVRRLGAAGVGAIGALAEKQLQGRPALGRAGQGRPKAAAFSNTPGRR